MAKRKESPNFSGSRYRECMRTAQIGPDLRLTHFRLTYVAQKDSLPVDVRRSKMSLLKLPNNYCSSHSTSLAREEAPRRHTRVTRKRRRKNEGKEKRDWAALFLCHSRLYWLCARGLVTCFFPSPFVLLTCFHPFGTCYTFCHVSSLPLTAALLGNLFVTHATPCRWEITLALYRLAWENSRHFATPPFVSSQSDTWETNVEIPYWCQTCHFQEMGSASDW